jgi:hypothetical protein
MENTDTNKTIQELKGGISRIKAFSLKERVYLKQLGIYG